MLLPVLLIMVKNIVKTASINVDRMNYVTFKDGIKCYGNTLLTVHSNSKRANHFQH
jgi:hypothetical protein